MNMSRMNIVNYAVCPFILCYFRKGLLTFFPVFKVSVHSRNLTLFKSMVNHWNCNNISNFNYFTLFSNNF